MKTEYIKLNTCVVGSGAAGYNAAVRMKEFGIDSVALVTEGVNVGTSRNTGSDKQTYYKLGIGGDSTDSVRLMAEDLFGGGCTDGDNALVEAALSTRCFMNLCELGVPFPTNRYGEYVGYKTDHDLHARATSVGPLTSRFMTEALERRAAECGVRVYDRLLVTEILKDADEVSGLVAVSRDSGEITVFACKNIIYATGGPAGMYADSVYPSCHHGSSGVAFAAGVKGQNLTEWQYGLASVEPRWNVSGTYMQVLPRFVSVDEDGTEHEFLSEYFNSVSDCLSMIFLKGYQWPFDAAKVADGSSVIDLLVYREKVLRGRRVYLDFMHNPQMKEELDFSILSDDARRYLENAGVCYGTPIERLEDMNSPAVELYMQKGVDLHREMLEIAVCAQHNNGGIAVDAWWQTNIKGFFACGEVAGTHGIYRPGGSALNAGQVGSFRAARYASQMRGGEVSCGAEFEKIAAKAVSETEKLIEKIKKNPDNVKEGTERARVRMSSSGGAVRDAERIRAALEENENQLSTIDCVGGDVGDVFCLRDTLICQKIYLSAMLDYCEKGCGSRGSALVTSPDGELREGLDECFRNKMSDGSDRKIVQEALLREDGKVSVTYRPVREIPDGGGFFENVWKGYRENGNVF